MYEGKNNLEGFIFIAGSFNNYPPVIIWSEFKGKANITAIGGDHNIEGLITSVSQVYLPYQTIPVLPPSIHPEYKDDYTSAILFGGVFVGVLLGLGFTAVFFFQKSEDNSDGCLKIILFIPYSLFI
jgi:hypothetical protein